MGGAPTRSDDVEINLDNIAFNGLGEIAVGNTFFRFGEVSEIRLRVRVLLLTGAFFFDFVFAEELFLVALFLVALIFFAVALFFIVALASVVGAMIFAVGAGFLLDEARASMSSVLTKLEALGIPFFAAKARNSLTVSGSNVSRFMIRPQR